MGMTYLALSAFFSLSVAQVLKVLEIRSIRVMNVLVINYFVAVAISIYSTEWDTFDSSFAMAPIWIHAGILGVLFIANFVVYSKSIDKNGMGVSIAAMRMSLVFPILLSLIVYNEPVSIPLILGIILSFIALFLLVPKLKKDHKIGVKITMLPIMLFFISGITDVGLKVFEQEFSRLMTESQFLAGLFFFAFLTGLSILSARKQLNFTLKEFLYGIVLGVVNLYSSYFILLALKELPGSIVFPVANLSIVFIGTFIGIFIWKDKLVSKQWIGLGLASISIFLLLA